MARRAPISTTTLVQASPKQPCELLGARPALPPSRAAPPLGAQAADLHWSRLSARRCGRPPPGGLRRRRGPAAGGGGTGGRGAADGGGFAQCVWTADERGHRCGRDMMGRPGVVEQRGHLRRRGGVRTWNFVRSRRPIFPACPLHGMLGRPFTCSVATRMLTPWELLRLQVLYTMRRGFGFFDRCGAGWDLAVFFDALSTT